MMLFFLAVLLLAIITYDTIKRKPCKYKEPLSVKTHLPCTAQYIEFRKNGNNPYASVQCDGSIKQYKAKKVGPDRYIIDMKKEKRIESLEFYDTPAEEIAYKNKLGQQIL